MREYYNKVKVRKFETFSEQISNQIRSEREMIWLVICFPVIGWIALIFLFYQEAWKYTFDYKIKYIKVKT